MGLEKMKLAQIRDKGKKKRRRVRGTKKRTKKALDFWVRKENGRGLKGIKEGFRR